MTVAADVLRLSQGLDKTLFVLRDEPLYVEGPDGQPMIVAARTALGPTGAIELHRDSVKTMLPTQILFLLTHEFLHKANYAGRSVSDNETIPPFATGRDLLDNIAREVVAVARRKGTVGTQFGIRDIFDCQVFSNHTQVGLGALISSSRFFHSEDLMTYDISIGKNPTDGSIYIPETTGSRLRLKFLLTEPNNCGDPDPRRRGTIQIVRSFQAESGEREEAVVAEQSVFNNPVCPRANPNIEISSGKVKFACRYFGSEGTTSSQYSLRRQSLRPRDFKE